jgi:hypothetical protein
VQLFLTVVDHWLTAAPGTITPVPAQLKHG